MKRLMCLLVALLVAPAMAGVTISVVDNGDLTADIVVVADGDDADANGSLIAGIALDVSVDAGVITDVYNFKTTGESVVGDKGYGIFLGTITFTGDDPVTIASTGTPVAPADAPDNPPQLPGPACVLEFGALYDQAVPAAAPETTTVLCTITVSEACNMTLAANSTRGGVVRIGGGAVTANLVGGPITGDDGCYVAADKAEWEAVGKPESWCRKTQCHGDADGEQESLGFGQFTWVGSKDVAALVAAYRKKLGDPAENLACDFDHAQEALGFGQYTRVGSGDVAILVQYYRMKVTDMPADCNQ